MEKTRGEEKNSSFKTALIVTCALRVFYSGLGAVLTPYLKLDPALIKSNDFTGNLMTRDAGWLSRLLGVWERFDTLWYLHLAERGYDRVEATVFYPLYPLLIKVFTPLLRQPLAAALLISTVATFFLFLGFQKLLALDLPQATIQRAVLLYALWPGSFMLLAGYPDSLLTALVIWSIYAARRERWAQAGLFGFLAGLSKAAGALVVIPLAVIAWRRRDWRAWPAAFALLALPAFSLFVKLAGYPPASEVYPRYWHTEVAFPWSTIGASLKQALNEGGDLILLFNLLMLLLIFTPALVKRIRPEYFFYSLAALFLFLTKKTDPLLQSTGRYVLAVFPAFASWAILLNHPLLFVLMLAFLMMINLFLLMAFFEWALVV